LSEIDFESAAFDASIAERTCKTTLFRTAAVMARTSTHASRQRDRIENRRVRRAKRR